jgi:L-seryl-tRNA(Ser) seleniumtransferase
MAKSRKQQGDGVSRRNLMAGGGSAALAAAAAAAQAADNQGYAVTSKIYESLNVRPFINARGTFTILTGSQSLPEVKQAMMEASRHYVHLDELMEGVSKRLAELTKAEYGIVTAGCAAAITHATAACIAGADPERMQRLPDLTGLKNQVVMPRYSRNQYDHASRMLGVKIVEVETEDQLRAALGPQTAMVLILSCPAAERGPLTVEVVSRIARTRDVPVLVDAAAETLTIPNIHLAHGAHMVAYSGGKCLRGPQAAGLLLGQKDLLQAAWLNSAPHHAFGRSLKAGKEEIMGMLAAVEMWVRRDHAAEWKAWESWNAAIGQSACRVAGVTSEILQPEDLSNHAPRLRLRWDPAALGITGTEVRAALDKGEPRIILAGASKDSVTVMPYMMNPGDHKFVAAALYKALSSARPSAKKAEKKEEPAAAVAGVWKVQVAFKRGQTTHELRLAAPGADGQIQGTHKMEWLSNPVRGSIEGSRIQVRSSHRYEGTVLDYDFQGEVKGGAIEGELLMGEYGSARFKAERVS